MYSFFNSLSEAVTPSFSDFTDTSLVLLSPALGVASGATETYTFYYQFDPIASPPTPVPAPAGCADLTTNDAGYGYQTISQTLGVSAGYLGGDRVPSPCRPTVCVRGMCVVESKGLSPFMLVARGDTTQISAIDTVSVVPVNCFEVTFGPFSPIGADPRSGTWRVARILVWGEGIITDGTIQVIADRDYNETYSAVAAVVTPNSPLYKPNLLFYQEVSPGMVGSIIQVALTLNGIGMALRACRVEWSDV
jgi:hypothetical protein